MTWGYGAQIVSDSLAVVLICRLAVLRLYGVYRIFSAFLIFDLFASLLALILVPIHAAYLDYRVTWIVMRPIVWALSLGMVYALLNAILSNLKGIRRFSQKLLNVTFFLAFVFSVLTSKPEYSTSGFSEFLGQIDRYLGVAFIIERVISSVAVVVLLIIACFILWFPVSISQNLAIFAFVFTVYFGSKTGLLLLQSFVSHTISQNVSTLVSLVLAACFGVLIFGIRKEGEVRPIVLGHNWSQGEQQRLFEQLHAVNDALLKGG